MQTFRASYGRSLKASYLYSLYAELLKLNALEKVLNI